MKNYDYVGDYYEGFAMVELNEKWGFINREGKEICEIKYDFVGDYHNGFARVKLNGKWGFINREGKEICELKYDWVGSYTNGYAGIKVDGKCAFIDKQGKEIIEIKLDNIYDFKNGFAGVLPCEEKYYINKNDDGYEYKNGELVVIVKWMENRKMAPLINNIDSMTLEEAKQIREARLNDYTWRAIAKSFWEKDLLFHKSKQPDSNWSKLPSNQLAGVELCEKAAQLLGEDPYDEPWD